MEDNKMLPSICLRIVEGLLISVCTSCRPESLFLYNCCQLVDHLYCSVAYLDLGLFH